MRLPLLLLVSSLPLFPLHAQTFNPGMASGSELSCMAPAGGSPCGEGGPASLELNQGADAGVGNPIHVATGNKYQREVDLPAMDGELGLEVVRHYNSSQRHVVGLTGAGWRLSYETDLFRVGDAVQILQADGSRLDFAPDPKQPGTCRSQQAAWGHIEMRAGAQGTEYVWHWTHGAAAGRRLSFNAQGRLVQIQSATGALLLLKRGPRGELLSVTDPQGRQLQLRYQQAATAGTRTFAGVQRIHTPNGHIDYQHGPDPGFETGEDTASAATLAAQGANLRRVSWQPHGLPEQQVRHYHHEDPRHPQALTGISRQGTDAAGGFHSQRLSHYRYSAQGLAVYSERQGEVVELLQLQRARPGRDGYTVLRNALGQQSLYRHRLIGGSYRLTEAYGSGCSSCTPVNRRWTYDSQGRLLQTTLLDPVPVRQGQTQGLPRARSHWQRVLDGQGRVIELRQLEVGRTGQQAHWLRLSYDDPRWPDKPTRMERPSVVSGQVYQRLLRYHPAGPLQQLTEIGYSPIGGSDEPALADGTGRSPQRLERVFEWHYAEQHGRLRWVGVDGPLPNGPSQTPLDSDITRLQWDLAGGGLQSVQLPGQDPTPVNRNTLATLVDTWFGARWTSPWAFAPVPPPAAPLRPLHRLDDFGRRVLSHSPNSGTVQMAYDAADRLVWMRDAQGHTAHYQHDLQHRIRQQDIQDARGGPLHSTRWQYDGQRLLSVQSPQQQERFVHDPAGRWTQHQLTLGDAAQPVQVGIDTQLDAQGHAVARSLPDGSLLRLQRDAQGRLQALRLNPVRTPWLRWLARERPLLEGLQHDPAGRPLHWRLGNGIGVWLHRDRQGRPWRLLHAGQPGATQQAVLDQYLGWSAAGNLAWRWQAEGTPQGQGLLDSHAYDARHRLLVSVRSTGPLAPPTGASAAVVQALWTEQQLWRYAYDRHDRRIAQQVVAAAQTERLAGTQGLLYADGSHQRLDTLDTPVPSPGYSASGEPLRAGQRQLEWDALGRLRQLRWQDQGQLRQAHYGYDHRGLRNRKQVDGQTTYFLYDALRQPLAELDAEGRVRRQYVYMGSLAVAVLDLPRPQTPAQLDGPRWWSDLWPALRSWWQPPHQIHWLHSNHLGAPEAATDPQGRTVWRASYSPDGAATVQALGATPWSLALRLPGQVFDDESGLHYNRQRYYDPQRGHYLTPDPLGLPDGPNPYAYVAHNPWRYVDPDGLLLFAFDGTGNDERLPQELSNVVRFRQLYDDGAQFYITGPGTLDPRSGIVNPWYRGGNPLDAAFSFTGKERVARLLQDLSLSADAHDDRAPLDIDVIGFSRGAAEARDFMNQVADDLQGDWYLYTNQALARRCQRLNLRFLGLWDTVLSSHVGDYRLGIPAAVDHVAHALALNEYRSLFPAESILSGPYSPMPVAGQVRVEQGLLGSHSDIGGSFPDGELAQVALAWMVQQARAAGVRMDEGLLSSVAAPTLHDKSSNLTSASGPVPTHSSEDRVLRYLGGSSIRQRQASVPGMSYGDTLAFIDFDPSPSGQVAGWVDLPAYLAWLAQQGLPISLAVR